MSKTKVIAKENLYAFPFSWTKGLDCELVQKEEHFTLASNEGQVNYVNEIKQQVLENFEVVQSNLNWDNYFMVIAKATSLRSKDPNTQVGVVIVDKNNRIISTGYNGMPNKCDDKIMPWSRDKGLNGKYMYVIHAEMNAILHSKTDLQNCKMYVTLFPCNKCAGAIIQSGIKEVIYLSDKYKDREETIAAKFMFDNAGVKYRQLESDLKIEIDLGKGD